MLNDQKDRFYWLFTVSQLQAPPLLFMMFVCVNYNSQTPSPIGFWLGSAEGKAWVELEEGERTLPAPSSCQDCSRSSKLALSFFQLALSHSLLCPLGRRNVRPTVLLTCWTCHLYYPSTARLHPPPLQV